MTVLSFVHNEQSIQWMLIAGRMVQGVAGGMFSVGCPMFIK